MTGSVPLVFPGGRTLAGWWRQLAPRQPRTWWVGHLLLHRVEALAALVRPSPLDPLHRFVLQALALTPGVPLAALDDRLHLGRQLLGQLLRVLQAERLAQAASDSWAPTDAGRAAVAHGEYARTVHERRPFFFVEPEVAERAPHFLALDGSAAVPLAAGDDWHFDPALLAACVARPEEWKRRFGFPAEVTAVVTGAADGGPPEWQRVVVDRPERLPVAVVRTADDRLLGFAAKSDGWALQSEAPVFELGAGWPEVFPQLTEAPPAETWQQAWQAWCQPRGLAGLGVETCVVRPEGHLLRVAAPPRLMERLKATRSDALKGEAWVLAGAGRLRAAALLDVVEEGAGG